MDWIASEVRGKYGNFTILSRGLASQVYAVEDVCSKERVAVKAEVTAGALRHEAAVLRDLGALLDREYDNVRKTIIVAQEIINCKTPRRIALVTPLYDGDLFNLLENQNSTLSVEQLRSFGRQMFTAVDFIHRHNLVHGDIKCENFMFRKNAEGQDEVALGDFGVARLASHGKGGLAGTLEMKAPELLLGLDIQPATAADMWGLAVTWFVLAAAYFPFQPVPDSEYEERSILASIVSMTGLPPSDFPSEATAKVKQISGSLLSDLRTSDITTCLARGSLHSSMSPPREDFVSLLTGLLQWLPKDRLKTSDLFKHAFFCS